jgi:hypothetical protein
MAMMLQGYSAADALAEVLGGVDIKKLVEDLAAEIRPEAEIWRSYGVRTVSHKDSIVAQPMFEQLLNEARGRWHAPDNHKNRVRQMALAAVELGITPLFTGMSDDAKPLSSRVDAFRALARVAGVETDPALAGGAGGGQVVAIRIDLGGGRGVIEVGARNGAGGVGGVGGVGAGAIDASSDAQG